MSKQPEIFDLGADMPSEREVELTHVDTDMPIGVHVMLLPLTDKKVDKVRRRIRDDYMKLHSKGKSPKSMDVENNEMDMIIAAMTGWRWEADEARGILQPGFNGETNLEFSPRNIKAFFRQCPWYKEQLDLELENIGDFFGN